jgi:hypothetical protein
MRPTDCRYCGYPLTPLFHDFPCQPMRSDLDGVMQARANLEADHA